MKSIKKLKYVKLGAIGLIAMIVLTAFGCKKQEEDQTDNDSLQPVSTEQITYNQAEPVNTPTTDNNTQQDISNSEGEINSNNENKEDTTDSKTEESDKSLLLEQAEKLAEIYGTFTNKDKNAYKNLKDLKQYSTVKLNSWFDEKSKVPVDSNALFYGVTTSALSSVVLEKDNSKSEVIVTVKKEEITSSSNTPKVSYRILLMSFEKSKEEWELSGIFWQN